MIELKDISVTVGEFSLSGISFQVPAGIHAALMGRTGRGKTTILETICGLRRPTSGQVLIDGVDVTDWQPGDRQVGYVPQDLALFPTLSVRQQLDFAQRLRRTSPSEMLERTEELAETLGIKHLLDRSIAGLSGGESQRVALGRALSFRPSVLLLDEPLSALDDESRAEIQDVLRTIKNTTGVTTLHVTHSHAEVAALADLTLSLDEQVTVV